MRTDPSPGPAIPGAATSQPERMRLVVVSNRLPLTARRVGDRWRSEPSSGGLVAALGPLMRQTDGEWIGWPGEASSDDPDGHRRLVANWRRRHRLVAVDLPATISSAFYDGYANDTLWPLLHAFPTLVSFDPASWVAYGDANQRFADTVATRLQPGDLVWVHDYQLMLVPALLRQADPEVRVGYFLHIPFPSSEVFRILPQREALLRGLLGADVIGFQTHEHLHNFRRSLQYVLGLESQMDSVDVDGRSVRMQAFPIGVVASEWDELMANERVRRRVDQLRSRHRGRRLVVAIDRLDYTKGIPERLRALRRLLRASPARRATVTLVQVAIPTRERVPLYQELRREVSELVGEINGEFGTPDWTPIVYLRRSIPRPELAALYAAADVAWVTPLRDGMNLVAKEYVVCRGDGAGALILSEFAGAAAGMAEAIRVNPYDEDGMVETLERALDMSLEEQRERMSGLGARVRRDDAVAWSDRFLGTLREAVAPEARDRGPKVEPLRVSTLLAAWRAAASRFVYLDYDGTLVPIAQRPQDARPDAALAHDLSRLCAQPGTSVVLVSGRGRHALERWFGHVEGIWIAAEHGALVKPADTDEWSPLHPGTDSAWMGRVRSVLDHYTALAPGSLIEEKEYSIAWHYRLVDTEFGEWLANDVASALDGATAGTDLAVLRGRKVIEVRFAWATKGELFARVSAQNPDPELILAAGDDRTDEDLFERLSPGAWSIHVGPPPTRARYGVRTPAEMRAVLTILSQGADHATP